MLSETRFDDVTLLITSFIIKNPNPNPSLKDLLFSIFNMSSFEPPSKRIFLGPAETKSNRLQDVDFEQFPALATRVKATDVIQAFRDMLSEEEVLFNRIIPAVYDFDLIVPGERLIDCNDIMRTCDALCEEIDRAINSFSRQTWFNAPVSSVPGQNKESRGYRKKVLRAFNVLNDEIKGEIKGEIVDLDKLLWKRCTRLWEHTERGGESETIPEGYADAGDTAYRLELEPLGRNASRNYLPDISFLFSYLLLLTLEVNNCILRGGDYLPVLNDIMNRQLPTYVYKRLQAEFRKKEVFAPHYGVVTPSALMFALPPSMRLPPRTGTPPSPSFERAPLPPPPDNNDDLFDGDDMN